MPSVITTGFKEFEQKLKNLEPHLRVTVNGFVEDAALLWEERAKLDAPNDQGSLVGKIVAGQAVNMTATVSSGVLYSPYVEWGTGTRVSVPGPLQAYAIQFKGVLKVIGRYPHPYFFIQTPFVEKQLYDDIKNYLSTPK